MGKYRSAATAQATNMGAVTAPRKMREKSSQPELGASAYTATSAVVHRPDTVLTQAGPHLEIKRPLGIWRAAYR